MIINVFLTTKKFINEVFVIYSSINRFYRGKRRLIDYG